MDGFDGRDVLGVVIVCSSRGYSGRLPIFIFALSLSMYLDFYDTAQNYSCDLLHSI